MSESDEWAVVDAELVGERVLAFELEFADETRWVPKSVCGVLDEDGRTIEIKTWWAEKEGLV